MRFDVKRRASYTLDKESKLIDAAVTFSYQKYHKLFLSDNKELEQNVMWSTAVLSARSAKGQEVKATFSTASGIKGAEVIDEIREKIDEVIEKVMEIRAEMFAAINEKVK